MAKQLGIRNSILDKLVKVLREIAQQQALNQEERIRALKSANGTFVGGQRHLKKATVYFTNRQINERIDPKLVVD